MRKAKIIFSIFFLFVLIVIAIEALLLQEFLKKLESLTHVEPPYADAIICLTGGSNRILESLRLLNEGKAEKLFLSGVNKEVSLDNILKIITMDIPEEVIRNIIIDQSSVNTFENARESLMFVQNEGYHSIILLTSHYHMVRALYIFTHIFPKDIVIYPYPIMPSEIQSNHWWDDVNTRRIIILEFLKYSWYRIKLLVASF